MSMIRQSKSLIISPCGHLMLKRYYPQLPKRFYGEVTVSQNPETQYFEINLDRRKLKTPGQKLFQVRSEGLAHAIAHEWGCQEGFIQQAFMHLTALANTVQDNPLYKTKYTIVDEILAQLPEDTIIYRAPDTNYKLLELQDSKWDPIIEWFESQFQNKFKIPIMRNTILPQELQSSVNVELGNYLCTKSFEQLQGLAFATGAMKSVILPIAILKGRLSVKEATDLSRLETTYQTEYWGNVEWAHDLELHETTSRVSAGIVFHDLHANNV